MNNSHIYFIDEYFQGMITKNLFYVEADAFRIICNNNENNENNENHSIHISDLLQLIDPESICEINFRPEKYVRGYPALATPTNFLSWLRCASIPQAFINITLREAIIDYPENIINNFNTLAEFTLVHMSNSRHNYTGMKILSHLHDLHYDEAAEKLLEVDNIITLQNYISNTLKTDNFTSQESYVNQITTNVTSYVRCSYVLSSFDFCTTPINNIPNAIQIKSCIDEFYPVKVRDGPAKKLLNNTLKQLTHIIKNNHNSHTDVFNFLNDDYNFNQNNDHIYVLIVDFIIGIIIMIFTSYLMYKTINKLRKVFRTSRQNTPMPNGPVGPVVYAASQTYYPEIQQYDTALINNESLDNNQSNNEQ